MSENPGLLDIQIAKESLKYLNKKAQELKKARLIFTGFTITPATIFAYAGAKGGQTPAEVAIRATFGAILGLFAGALSAAFTEFNLSSIFPKVNEEVSKHQDNVTAGVLSGDLRLARYTNKNANDFVFYARGDGILSNPIRVRKSSFLPQGRLQVYAEITKQHCNELNQLRKDGVNTNTVNGFTR